MSTDPVVTATPEALPVDPQTQAHLDWQDRIHHELKAINGKLSWFVLLSVLGILGGIISFLNLISSLR